MLCRSINEQTTFRAADQPCADVVVFTAESVMTFQVLNLSSNGVIQPLQSIPRVPPVAPIGAAWGIDNDDDSGREENVDGL